MDDFYLIQQERVQNLFERQNAFLSKISGNRLNFSDNLLLPEAHKCQLFLPPPNIVDLDYSLDELRALPQLDSSVFAKWHVLDIPVMFGAGILGSLSSAYLRDWFDALHSKWGNLDALRGGHGGEGIDWVPGADQPGGFGHRFKFGHDLFNPFEIDWKEYVDKASASGTHLPLWMKAAFYWMRHLFQDTFSKEGLALPGHSLLRDYIDPVKNKELIKYFGTIKTRDLTGSCVTNLIMGGYIWGTEDEFKKVFIKPNYRGFSLMLGANFINVITGIVVPPPLTSLNWSAIPIIGYYFFQLIKLEIRIRKELKIRDNVLNENAETLLSNMQKIAENEIKLSQMLQELMQYDAQVQKYYKETNDFQDFLANRILN